MVELRTCLQQAQEVVAIDFGQTDIEEDQVRDIVLACLKGFESLKSILIAYAGYSTAVQDNFYDFTHNHRVINDNNVTHISASFLFISCQIHTNTCMAGTGE